MSRWQMSRSPAYPYNQDLVGAASGSGFGGHYCEEGIPTEAALLIVLAAFAISFGMLYMASTTNKASGRKKRDGSAVSDINIFADLFWQGK